MPIASIEIKREYKVDYFSITEKAAGDGVQKTIDLIRKTISMTHMLRRHGLQSEKLTLSTLLKVWRMSLLPNTSYRIHLIPRTPELKCQ